MLTRLISIRLLMQVPRAVTIVFRPRLASIDDGLLIEKVYECTTAIDGTGSIALPVKSVGSIRWDIEIPGITRKTRAHFYLSAGGTIDLAEIILAGGIASDSVKTYIDAAIAAVPRLTANDLVNVGPTLTAGVPLATDELYFRHVPPPTIGESQTVRILGCGSGVTGGESVTVKGLTGLSDTDFTGGDFAALLSWLNTNKATIPAISVTSTLTDTAIDIVFEIGPPVDNPCSSTDTNVAFVDWLNLSGIADTTMWGNWIPQEYYSGKPWYALEGQTVAVPGSPWSGYWEDEWDFRQGIGAAVTSPDNVATPNLATTWADYGIDPTGIDLRRLGTATVTYPAVMQKVAFGASNVLTIGTAGMFTTIKAAMAYIAGKGDATTDNLYILSCLPSWKRADNTWNTFQWLPYVGVEWAGGQLNQRRNIPAGPDENGMFAFSREFVGTDFSLCVAASPVWTPFALPMFGVVFSSFNANGLMVNAVTDLTSQNVAVGTVIPVNGDAGITTNGSVWALSAADYTTAANWIDVTPNLAGLSLQGLGLQSGWWYSANCTSANFSSANCTTANFSSANCTSASFQFANCTSVNFGTANCTSANFSYANCTSAGFGSANCNNANFSYANCTSAGFYYANCTDAIFQFATLTNANLTGALCDGANFTGATMPPAAATKGDFKALVGSWNATTTIWTDGNPIG